MKSKKKKGISEKALLNAHLKAGHERYGRRWDIANIGWASGDGFISSKVYGDPAHVFTSEVRGGRIKHTHEKYR